MALVSLPWVWACAGGWEQLAARTPIRHGPEAPYLFFATLLAPVAAWAFRRLDGPAGRWLAAWLAACVLALAAPSVTGFSVHPEYWVHLGNLGAALVAAIALARRFPRPRAWAAALVVVCVLSAIRGTAYAVRHYPSRGLASEYDQALLWLDGNARPGSIVAALSPQAHLLLGAYSSFGTVAALNSPVASRLAPAENAARLVSVARLAGVPPGSLVSAVFDAAPQVTSGPDRSAAHVGAERVYASFLYFNELPPLDARAAVSGALASSAPFRADYLWWGPFERQWGARPLAPGLREVYANAWVSIYALGEARP
jgi:hypothetical protein